VEANSTGGQGSRRAVAPSDDDDAILFTNIPTNNVTHYTYQEPGNS
jgi:hypothetical protein